MALRLAAISRNAGDIKGYNLLLQRWAHPAPLDRLINQTPVSPQLVLPESSQFTYNGSPGIGSELPGLYVGNGSMELMAVPKRKTSPHKRGIRNGPKALKPVPVIVRCNGLRENPDGQD